MTVLGLAAAVSRRMVVTSALGVCLSVASTAWAQAQAAPAAQEDPFKFSSDGAVMVYTIKADKVGDFEAMWAAIRTKLAASEKPELKGLAESLRIYKVASGATADGQTYFFVADPASKTSSYGLSPFLLFTSGLFTRPEADAMFEKVKDAIAGLNAIPLTKIP